ncbi:MAG: Adenylate cyclase [Candidatus Rifleibacterium amylolyticum]|nr:MAG: Adenylate cyclase [Candidatus Rifleibacterium amylolyticum]
MLILPVANIWDKYQTQLEDTHFVVEAEEEATALVQQFKANCPVEVQISKRLDRIQSLLDKSADPFAADGTMIRQMLQNLLPENWLSEDAVFYVFRFSGNEGRALTGSGLERTSSAFLARIANGLRKWQSLGATDKNKINNRLSSLFGERISGELLLSNRSGRFIDVVFNGKRRYLLWDFLNASDQQAGAFMIISGKRPEIEDAAVLAMQEIARQSGHHQIYSALVPIESLHENLKPVVLEQDRSEKPVLNLFSLLAKYPQHGKIASLSAGNLHDDTFVFRSGISRKLPYELWLTALKPDSDGLAISSLYSGALMLLWFSVVFMRLRRGRPFDFSVKHSLLGLVAFVGGLPILILVVAGKSAIEHDHHLRYRSMVNSMREELREIDGNSTSLRTVFENLARRYLADAAFKSAIISEETENDSDVLRRCFEEFAANDVPLSSIGITMFGSHDRLILPPEANRQGDTAHLHVFAPMMYAGLKDFSEEDHRAAMAQLDESKRLGLETYRSIANNAVFSDVAFARQKSLLMSFGDAGHYIIYDFIADQGKIVASILFFTAAAEAQERFAARAILRGNSATPDRLWAMAKRHKNLIKATLPERRRTFSHESWFLQRLAAAQTNSSLVVEDCEDTLTVCQPCEHMQGIVLGSTSNLKPLFSITAYRSNLLTAAALLLFVILIMVTNALISYFIMPLHIIDSGITSILDRKFDLRLRLNRDDELGDVADAFDEMAQGLCERNELAQFVSGTLANQLDIAVQADKKPQKRWGAVLASDIRNFTTLSETWLPEQIVELLNRHLELMSTRITENGGEIDKFIGDAIIAVFFAEDRATAAQKAVNAAQAMIREHRNLVEQRNEEGSFTYGMGIGIACGKLLVGSFGAGDRHEYSLSGEARHLSEVLEAESKRGQYTHIIVSHEFRDLLPHVAMESLADSEYFEVVET